MKCPLFNHEAAKKRRSIHPPIVDAQPHSLKGEAQSELKFQVAKLRSGQVPLHSCHNPWRD